MDTGNPHAAGICRGDKMKRAPRTKIKAIRADSAAYLGKAVTVKGPNNILFYHGQSTFTDVSPTLKRSGPHEETSPGGGDKTTSVSVIEIEGFPKPTGCQVHVTEIVESTTRRNGQIVSTQTSRDRRADLEIEIVGMFDPQTAARILREGEEARASGEWYPPKKK